MFFCNLLLWLDCTVQFSSLHENSTLNLPCADDGSKIVYAKRKSVPLQARGFQRVPGSYGSHITWKWPRMMVRLSALHTKPFNHQEIFLLLISIRGWVDSMFIVRSEGLCQWKISMTPSGIDPGTFQFVTQHLNHCATAVSVIVYVYVYLCVWENINVNFRLS